MLFSYLYIFKLRHGNFHLKKYMELFRRKPDVQTFANIDFHFYNNLYNIVFPYCICKKYFCKEDLLVFDIFYINFHLP